MSPLSKAILKHIVPQIICLNVLLFSLSDVDPLQTFWISNDYYERVAEYYLQQNIGKEPGKEIEREAPEAD